jgi:hypothetical protein
MGRASPSHRFHAGGIRGWRRLIFTTSAGKDRVDGSRRVRFVFQTTVATRDRPLLEALRVALGNLGSVTDLTLRNPRWQPLSSHRVTSRTAIRRCVLPFFDEFLLPSAKRDQFDAWRARFEQYERDHPSRWDEARPPVQNPGATNRCADVACAAATTTVPPATDLSAYVSGFVAAEATFTVTGSPPSFTFAISLGAQDRASCALACQLFDRGHAWAYPRRHAHFDDEVHFSVRKMKDLVEVVVPFMDEHLPPSHKREQYLVWRAQLLDYWKHDAKRRRPCTIDGCERLQRAKGLCRQHYFQQYRR